MNNNNHKKFLRFYLITSLLILFIGTFFIFPNQLFDTVYYWTWSKHLAASYLDGPPMIAYAISGITHIFGDRIASLNLLAFIFLILSGFVVYKIARIFSEKEHALMIMALWMFYPFSTIRFLYMSLTLDNVEMLFSLIIIYFACCLIKTKNNHYIYYLGFSCGLGLLAKYNVIFLIIAILIYFACDADLRYVYRRKEVYIATIIALILFSPVLIWNYQHHFASFIMQLTTHSYGTTNKHGMAGVLFYLTGPILSTFFFWILVLLYLLIRKISIFDNNNPYSKFLFTVSIIIFLIWLPISYFAHIGLNYVVVTDSLMLIVISNVFIKHYKKISMVFLILFMLINIITIFTDSQIARQKNRNGFTNLYCRPESPFNCGITIHYSAPTEKLTVTHFNSLPSQIKN
ncbi:MAG TPA: glycosyltransferase family 39 protein [Coxiellaceae bacterium]|nr:MAG: hypothetical protein A3E81_06625 [Gammaproteobacteria bacterium RIFCSPHIGHO2_12_FULL_36_30]HLB56498.1 glycosyltransferase family 39 protein [Coxiellaceae bacterium]